MNTEVEKLTQEKLSIQSEINTLQGELNKMRNQIYSNKNSEDFVKISKIQQEVKDLKNKLDGYSGIQSKITELKQSVHERESKQLKLNEKIKKLEQEIFSYEEMIQEKKKQTMKLTEKNENFRRTLQSFHEDADEEFKALIDSINSQKDELSRLSKEIMKITSVGADPYFLQTKSEQKLKALEDELEELQNYYKPELVEQMNELIPLKEAEKCELLENIEKAREEKTRFYSETEQIKEEIAGLEDGITEKMITIKERQMILRNMEEDNAYLIEENDRISKLQQRINETTDFEGVDLESIEKLKQEIYEIHKKWKTRENNYNNGIRSVNTRIAKLSSHINDLKKEVRQSLEKISKIKKN